MADKMSLTDLSVSHSADLLTVHLTEIRSRIEIRSVALCFGTLVKKVMEHIRFGHWIVCFRVSPNRVKERPRM